MYTQKREEEIDREGNCKKILHAANLREREREKKKREMKNEIIEMIKRGHKGTQRNRERENRLHLTGPQGCNVKTNPAEERERERDLETKEMNIIRQDQLDRPKRKTTLTEI